MLAGGSDLKRAGGGAGQARVRVGLADPIANLTTQIQHLLSEPLGGFKIHLDHGGGGGRAQGVQHERRVRLGAGQGRGPAEPGLGLAKVPLENRRVGQQGVTFHLTAGLVQRLPDGQGTLGQRTALIELAEQQGVRRRGLQRLGLPAGRAGARAERRNQFGFG
jgi:hypothetical protein